MLSYVKILATNACDSGADRRSKIESEWNNEFEDNHLLGSDFDSILNVQVCLSQIQYVAVQL